MRSSIISACFLFICASSCRHYELGGLPAENSSEVSSRGSGTGNSARKRVVAQRIVHDYKIRKDWVAMTGFGINSKPSPPEVIEKTCSRRKIGGALHEHPSIYSKDGVLKVTLSYKTSVGEDGNVRFCYISDEGKQNPSLHLKPGDRLQLTLRNDTPVVQSAMTMAMDMSSHDSPACGASMMTNTTTNLHYHGTNTRPVCHEDEVLKTMVNSGESFDYNLHIPADEPPGLYWYHPHIHGLAEAAVQGGATGALIIDGIEDISKEVRGLHQRTLTIRDQLLPPTTSQTEETPAWDISVNNTPILYPTYHAPYVKMTPGKAEFWRVANTAADAMFDLQILYDGQPQVFTIISLDAVPTNSQNNTRTGSPLKATSQILAPGNRVEFIFTPPGPDVKVAQLITRHVDTGPGGDLNPTRPLVNILLKSLTRASPDDSISTEEIPANYQKAKAQRFEGLDLVKPVAIRKLYFKAEDYKTPSADNDTNFYLVVDGQEPALFDPNLPPAITTTQGSTEDWIIENRTDEIHSFHIHQIHFLLLERNGKPVPLEERQYRDVVNVPYWSGQGPYPSVKVRMDFRGPYVGDFVYHCHILEHEDKGMMAIIRVLPRGK